MRKWIIISVFACLLSGSSCGSKVKPTSGEPALPDPVLSDPVQFSEVGIGKARHSISDEDRSCSPYFLVQSDDPSKSWMPLHSTRADVKITGAIANVKVQQLYVNESKKTLDAVYVFPGSTRAAVYGLDMTIGKRTIHAKVMEREEARRGFDQAKNEGKRATLLEQERPNVFRMEVANILPGDTIKVDMFYTELIEYRNKEYEFIYPTAVGPRYSTGNEAFVEQSIRQLESGHKPQFDICVTWDGAIPVQMVESSTYPIKVGHTADMSTVVMLSNPRDTKPGKDFILYYGLQGEKVESGLTLYEHGDEKFFLLMVQPPKQTAPKEILPREYIFIVDVSGSMNGFPLDVSKTILKKLISSLKPTDCFNVLLFESSQAMMSKKSLPATPGNIRKAINVIDNQEGGGGTELYPALETAFEYKDPDLKNYARTFVIATDGYVTVEQEAFKLIANNLNNANFIPLGIGESVNRFLIEGMAWAGASEPFIIENKTKAEVVGSHLIKTISQPLLSNISIDWGSLEPYDMYPKKVPNVFSERPVVIFGKYKGRTPETILVKGKTADGVFEQRISGNKVVKSGNEALRYLWARNKISYLSDYAACFESYETFYDDANGHSDRHEKEITELGLKYNLLTKYTSFLAVDNQKEVEIMESNKVYDISADFSACSDEPYIEMESSTARKSGEFASPPPQIMTECKEMVVVCDEAPVQEVFTHTEEMPKFPGGDAALRKFITANLKYPKQLDGTGIKGKVILRFVIDENGNVKDIEVLRSLDALCDAEAIRVVKLMPKWIPGKNKGKNVRVYYTLPITF